MATLARISRCPRRTLVVLLLLSTGAAWFASRVRFENSIEVWFPEGDPAVATYDEFSRQFHADELIVLAVDGEVFCESTYESLRRLSERAAKAPHVHRVRSVLDFDLDGDAAGGAVDWSARKARALRNSLITPMLVSEDAGLAGVVVETERAGNTVTGKRESVTALAKLAAEESERSGATVLLTGTPVLDHRALECNDRDVRHVYPWIIPLILVGLWCFFGELRFAWIPLTVVGAAGVWAFGFMGLVGFRSTLLSSTLVPLFLAIGVADSVHLLSEYRRQRRLDVDREIAVSEALARLWKPCFFTTITTAAGMSTMLVSGLRPVREFGLAAAVGVLAAFVLTVTLVPALLQLTPDRHPGAPRRVESMLGRVVHWLGRPPRVVTRWTLPASVILGVVTAVAATRVEIGVDPMSWLRAADPLRQATATIDTELGGAASIEFLVEAPDGGFANPDVLIALDDFERWVETTTSVTTCVSAADLVKEGARFLAGGGGDDVSLPDSRFDTEILLNSLGRRGELERWVSKDRARGRISCRLPLGQAAGFEDDLGRIREEVRERFAGTALRLEPTGYGVLMVQMEHQLIRSQLVTFSIAFVAVTLLLALLTRAPIIAAVAMLPNLLPVLVGLGMMPLLGISLNPGTVMVAAIALGIVVDDTAHLLVALRRNLDADANHETAGSRAIEEVGGAILLTSVILALSMGALTLGSFRPSVDFGVVSIVIIGTALLADLWILPRLVQRTSELRRIGGPREQEVEQ